MEQLDIESEGSVDEHERDDDLDLETSSLDASFINSKLSQDNLEDYGAFKKDMTRRVLVLEGKVERITADMNARRSNLGRDPRMPTKRNLMLVGDQHITTLPAFM